MIKKDLEDERGCQVKLDKVKDNAQLICDAIASVIDIDVTIVDDSLLRIAGTGSYQESIGKTVSGHSAFGYALRTGSEFIIENPGDHQACTLCDCKNKCNEHAEVCCPIKLGEETIGVIGLIAFESHQKEHIIANQINLLKFLNRMADLISSKVNEQKALEEMALLAKELEIVVDSLETGFVAVQKNGLVIRANEKVLKMINRPEINALSDIFQEEEVETILNLNTSVSNRPYSSKLLGQGLYDVSLIQLESTLRGYVIAFRAMEDVINTVNEVMTDPVTTKFEHIIGRSQVLEQVKALATKVAGGTSTVLIQGESGTGKELFSRAIHQASNRRRGPFIAINCAAIPEQLLESELFGYEEGAFTGAKKGGKPGKFQMANKGTLFLDEIGDMPLHLQSKLLRVLQEGAVERIGGKEPVPVDVRIVAATNQELENKVEEGAFRKDLFYRLNVIPIIVPPLRQRKEDIPELVWHLVKRADKKLGKPIGSIEETCFERLQQYDWPGNVRELENTIEYAVNMCDNNTLRIDCLPKKLQKRWLNVETVERTVEIVYPEFEESPVLPLAQAEAPQAFETISEMEKRAISSVLNYYKPYKKSTELAAKALGISRATLYRKIAEYKLQEES